ncbi:hypothetical protein [Eilatimonas milleporae]|uniref:Uncharacterized protein n=1 Tax=Eilatimonas milleporae TaxID=911205 RepID=A0A3M0D6L6_9PROT|nr:hypothetical protein [Eilatimonas milleporae]RMB11923.1 hypothetical protein BXY39_0410 [Eilatimonas milleporae]
MTDTPLAPTPIPLDSAGARDLRRYARAVLQLDVSDFENAGSLRAKIRAAAPDTQAIVPEQDGVLAEHGVLAEDSAPAQGDLAAAPGAADGGDMDGYLRILIPRQEKHGGGDPVPVNCNGRQIIVPRGREWPVKRKFVEILSHAVERQYSVTLNPHTREAEMTSHDVQAYPFQILGPWAGPLPAEMTGSTSGGAR